MTNCWFCGAEMIWGSDASYDEVYDDEGEGIVANLTCPNPNCKAEANFILRTDEEE